MGVVALRVRSLVWFVTGAVLAAAVTVMFMNAWRVDAAPGDDDATFVPITPCRLADTRPEPVRVGTAGAFGVADTKTFVVHGTQGDCTIPSDAVAVSMNVTAVGATVLSFLKFWPDGDQPLASSLNPAPGQPPIPNAVTVDLSDTGAFNIYNDKGTVNVVIDINGYYTAASLKELASRLAAVETSTAANSLGVTTNARDINAVEASAATNASGVTTNAGDIDAVEASAATNTAGIAGLDAAQPFAVTARDNIESLTAAGGVVVSVAVTAPVAGHVTVNSTTVAYEDTARDFVVCSITTGSTTDTDYPQGWLSSGTDGEFSQLAGTRMFEIAADATVTYNLVCEHIGTSGTSDLSDSVLTAIFTPAP